MEPRPPMDLWIMGLLYKLIVRGSRLHGAFGEKGLVRSVYPVGGMRGRSPASGRGVWRTARLDGAVNKRWVWEMERNAEAEKEPRGRSRGRSAIRRSQTPERTSGLLRLKQKADGKTAQAETSAEFTAWE